MNFDLKAFCQILAMALLRFVSDSLKARQFKDEEEDATKVKV